MLSVQSDPIDPGALLNALGARIGESGAVVSFTGVVRGAGAAGRVLRLELEHYPGFTEARIERRMAEVRARFRLEALVVAHRIGPMAPGETVVFVAAAAVHRRAAFEGADCLMDYLKSSAPFWKKEQGENGARWIEPTPQDHEDASRWTPQDTPR